MTQENIYGLHAVQSALAKAQGASHALKLIVLKGRQDKSLQKILSLAEAAGIPIERLTREELDQLSPDANHQGVILQRSQSVNFKEADIPTLLEALEKPAFILVLDGVQDPHNLGACIRTADAAGIDLIIIPKDKAVGITPVVRKVACGAAETLPVIAVTNLARTLRLLKDQGIWLYGTAGEVEPSVYETELTGPIAIVMGAEGKGLRQLTRTLCDGLMHIPMAGSVSSLNVSVATGVCCFEAVRQRQA